MLFDRSRIVTIESDVERIWLSAKIFDAQKKLRADPPEETISQQLYVLGAENFVDHVLDEVVIPEIDYPDAPPTHLFVCDALDGVFLMRLPASEKQTGYIARLDRKDTLEAPKLSVLPILVFPKILRSGKTYAMKMDDGLVEVSFQDECLRLDIKEEKGLA